MGLDGEFDHECSDSEHVEEECLESKLSFLNEIIQTPKPDKPHDLETIRQIRRRKSSSTSRKKNSPSRHIKAYDSYDTDEKIREKIRFITSKVVETRNYLRLEFKVGADEIYKWTIDFLSERGYWTVECTKDKFLISLYSVMMACRLHGIFLDARLLSLELGIPFKNFQKCVFECSPPITSTSVLDRKLMRLTLRADKFELNWEYGNILKSLLPEISPDAIENYKTRCNLYFDNLMIKGFCDEEKQFCVTADKVFIYGIFEVIRTIHPERTERSICEQLSEKFSIPRVTIEKMKRLVNKSLKKYPLEIN